MTYLPKILLLYGLSIPLFLGLVAILKKLSWFQPIYDLSPSQHQQKKTVPSLGGIGIWASILMGLGLTQTTSPSLWWCFAVYTMNALIGMADDGLAIRSKTNKGLSARAKFVSQWAVNGTMILVFHLLISPLTLPIAAFYTFILVATSNATNLTDGLDGLLAGSVAVSCIGFAWVGWHAQAEYLTQFAGIMFIAATSFLVVNRHPAKCFMGDCGSLALGSGLAAMAMCMGNPWLMLSFGLVYIVETVSVMVQVIEYKRSKKRIFLMAPLHHHFELLGLSEKNVVRLFWAIGALGVIVYIVRTA